MSLTGYASATSVAAGEALTFHLSCTGGRPPGRYAVTVVDVATGATMLRAHPSGPQWTVQVPSGWASSLYRAAFSSAGSREPDGPDADVHFVVRTPVPRAPALLSVPFATWQAYNRSGVPGEGLYYAEEPTRADRVSFDRPGGGPPTERWEHGLIQWLPGAGYPVDYCANLDLHDGEDLLAGYRLLIVNGHDEYWTAQMRDSVERFVTAGGNLAIFAANTSWWQIRLAGDRRTMICYRDAARDPLAVTDPARTTVEWSSAPVNRPENHFTGVSYGRGAGTWGEHMPRMREESYRVRFADHWVFEGTGLADGDAFARGALGYETDAADFEEVDGVPRATGRDGTPRSFVILATADLRHWRRYGQGGHATMGTFRLGAGTVVNAATVNWGAALGDPVVDRITRNVLDRLLAPGGQDWEVIGPGWPGAVLAACEGILFAAGHDGILRARELCGQNLAWREIDEAPQLRALSAPREAVPGLPAGLCGVTTDGSLVYRDPVPDKSSWQPLGGAAPADLVGLACLDGGLFAAAADGTLWRLAVADLGSGCPQWTAVDAAPGVLSLTGLSGLLFAVDCGGGVHWRRPVREATGWTRLTDAPAGATALAGGAGMLVAGGDLLHWRPAVP